MIVNRNVIGQREAFIDTTTEFIMFPQDIEPELLIPGTLTAMHKERLRAFIFENNIFPCNIFFPMPMISITFNITNQAGDHILFFIDGTKLIKVLPHYQCVSLLRPAGINTWRLGAAFLRRVYVEMTFQKVGGVTLYAMSLFDKQLFYQ